MMDDDAPASPPSCKIRVIRRVLLFYKVERTGMIINNNNLDSSILDTRYTYVYIDLS